MPLLSRVRVLAAKIETTSGTVEALTASEAAFNAFDAVMQPTGTFVARKGQGAFGDIKGTIGPRSGTCTFKTEGFGDGAGGVPTWASTFLPACGWVNTAGTYSPIAQPPGSSVKTLTLGLYENGMLKRLRGAVGNLVIKGDTGLPVMLEWTFTGVWVGATDVTILAPTYPTRSPIRVANGTISIGSWAPCFSNITLDTGNVIMPRSCITPTDGSGIHAYMISDRLPTATLDPEANLVATSNADVYGDWLGGEEDTFSLVVKDAQDTITFAGPKFQRTNVQEGDRQGLQIDNITAQFNRSASAGNDELTIAFSAT